MNPWVGTLIHWLHLSSVIAVLGGAIYVRFVVTPSASKLPGVAQEEFERQVRKRAIPVIHGGLLVLLISGFANIARVMGEGGRPPIYTWLLLVKIVLGVVVIALAGLLTVRAEGMESLNRHRGLWMLFNIVLGLIVVAISAYIRLIPVGV